MALSNIFREPRRELTETAVGVGVFSVLLWGDYHFAIWLNIITTDKDGGLPVVAGLAVGVVVFFLSLLLIALIHFIGEGLCDFMADHGLELRPKRGRH